MLCTVVAWPLSDTHLLKTAYPAPLRGGIGAEGLGANATCFFYKGVFEALVRIFPGLVSFQVVSDC